MEYLKLENPKMIKKFNLFFNNLIFYSLKTSRRSNIILNSCKYKQNIHCFLSLETFFSCTAKLISGTPTLQPAADYRVSPSWGGMGDPPHYPNNWLALSSGPHARTHAHTHTHTLFSPKDFNFVIFMQF